MTRCYVILRDTLGDGLDYFTNLDVDVIEEKDLDEAVQAAIDQILKEEGAESNMEYKEDPDHLDMASEIVILECSENVKGLPYDDYIKSMCDKYDESVKKREPDEYKEYLRLKKKFGS